MNRIVITSSLLLSLVGISRLSAGGLSTQLGEVVIENLQIGRTYNLRDLANLRLMVTNTSDFRVNLVMDVLQPDSAGLRHGALPIPEIGWVGLSKNEFILNPDGMAVSDISITIPDDREHMGKKYQFAVWSHTLGAKGGMSLAYGLRSRVIFTIDTVQVDAGRQLRSSGAAATLKLQPEEIHLDGLQIGEADVPKQQDSIIFDLINEGTVVKTVQLRSLTVENSVISLTAGFEDAPDPSFLRFQQDAVVLGPGEAKSMRAFLRFPADPEHRGKRYMFVIHAYSYGEHVTTGVYSRLYASLR
jgi:hypothetical protein